MRHTLDGSSSYCSEPIEFTIFSRIRVPVVLFVVITAAFGQLIGAEILTRCQCVKGALPRGVVIPRFKALREIEFAKIVLSERVLNIAGDLHTMLWHGVCSDRRHQSFGGRNSLRYRKGFQNGHSSVRCVAGMNERKHFTVRGTEERGRCSRVCTPY